MKRFPLLFLLIIFPAGFFHAQPVKKTASQFPFICSAAYNGLTYRDYQNPDAKKSFRCDGTSWIEILSDGAAKSPTVGAKDSRLVKIVFPDSSLELGFHNYRNSNIKNSYRFNDSWWIKNEFAAANLFSQNSSQLSAFNFFPSAQTRDTKRFELSGAASIGYNYSRVRTRPMDASGIFSDPTKTKSRELSLGLDLHFGTYLFDPRFITLSADAGLARDKGAFDDYETRNGIRGLGFAIDFLPTSPYPFRFRYINQNTNFLDRFGETTDSKRSILGFNWQLRKPNLPALVVNYDRISYDSTFAAASFFKTKGQTLSVTAADTFFGWKLNSGYNYQATDEKLTDLKTRQNFVQLQARKEISEKTDLFIGSFFEKLLFSSGLTGTEQKISLFDFYSDLNYRPTDRLDTRFSHRFYYNDNQSRILPRIGGSNQFAALDTTTYFNSFGGQFNYRLFSDLRVGAATNLNFIKSPGNLFESATQLHDFAVTASWNKSVKSFYFYANALEGFAYARSNFGNRRNTEFRSFNVGATFGDVRRALLSADYNYSHRPDIFQIGGYFSENNFSITATTEALRPFRLHASVGENRTVYLTSRGRENFERLFYSAGIEHRRFTVQFARNVNDGLRDIFATDFPIPTNRIFIVLPKDLLIRDPFMRTRGDSTSAMFRASPVRDLTIEARYIDDRVFFVQTNDVAVKQFDLIAYYKLGKFIFSCGYSRQKQMTENAFSRERDYYFCRATRTFKIL